MLAGSDLRLREYSGALDFPDAEPAFNGATHRYCAFSKEQKPELGERYSRRYRPCVTSS